MENGVWVTATAIQMDNGHRTSRKLPQTQPQLHTADCDDQKRVWRVCGEGGMPPFAGKRMST